MSFSVISAQEIPACLQSDSRLIDVRTPAEYRGAHVEGAELHPLDQLDASSFSAEPVYILCQSGKRARVAAQKLQAAGHEQVFIVDGGTDAAIQAGLPIIRGQGCISIERQVRIAAGALVFVGSLLGLFVGKECLAIPIFVGAGLVLAGVTNTCGMGLMLAKCPWNR